ncbi:GNAT family N-acetyltransferase [Streptomyces xiamenensis]|uniref:GNAT family N-acetyltransferase n=1 Tax=Streptomyces xiamenensis TaxID=408015 RepID=UPI0036EF13F2
MVDLHVLTGGDWLLWHEARIAALTDAPDAFKSALADWDKGGREQWGARLHIPGAHNVVALRDSHPVGVVRGVPADADTSELRSLWVSPQVRGEGVGERLVETVASWALRSGFTRLKLAVIPGNQPAIALYRRCGFVTTEERGDLLLDGETRERVMVRRLR